MAVENAGEVRLQRNCAGDGKVHAVAHHHLAQLSRRALEWIPRRRADVQSGVRRQRRGEGGIVHRRAGGREKPLQPRASAAFPDRFCGGDDFPVAAQSGLAGPLPKAEDARRRMHRGERRLGTQQRPRAINAQRGGEPFRGCLRLDRLQHGWRQGGARCQWRGDFKPVAGVPDSGTAQEESGHGRGAAGSLPSARQPQQDHEATCQAGEKIPRRRPAIAAPGINQPLAHAAHEFVAEQPRKGADGDDSPRHSQPAPERTRQPPGEQSRDPQRHEDARAGGQRVEGGGPCEAIHAQHRQQRGGLRQPQKRGEKEELGRQGFHAADRTHAGLPHAAPADRSREQPAGERQPGKAGSRPAGKVRRKIAGAGSAPQRQGPRTVPQPRPQFPEQQHKGSHDEPAEAEDIGAEKMEDDARIHDGETVSPRRRHWL